MNDNLPALEGTTSSEVFAKHLNALHAARKIFIQTEADARIRRALRNKVRALSRYLKMVTGFCTNGKEKSVGLDQGSLFFKMERLSL